MRRDLSDLSQVMGQTTVRCTVVQCLPKQKEQNGQIVYRLRENLAIPKLNFFILWIFICNKIILSLKSLRTTAFELHGLRTTALE